MAIHLILNLFQALAKDAKLEIIPMAVDNLLQPNSKP